MENDIDDDSPNNYGPKATSKWLSYFSGYQHQNAIIFDSFNDLFEKIEVADKDFATISQKMFLENQTERLHLLESWKKVSFKIILFAPFEHLNDLLDKLKDVDLKLIESIHVQADSERLLKSKFQNLPTIYREKIVVHGHLDCLVEFDLKGVHLTRKLLENQKNEAQFIEQIRENYPQKTISKSMHSFDVEMKIVNLYDYVFFGPIFDSISKKGHRAISWNHEKWRNLLKFAQIPIYGLGGITSKNIANVKAKGFCGAGILGDFWNHQHHLNRYKV